MAKKSYTVISNIIVYVLLLLLLTGTIGFFAVFTNGFKGDFKTFYLEYNGEKIISDKDHFPLSVQTQHRFDIRFPLDFFNKNTDKFGYTVKILPNVTKETDFTFTVNGITHTYSKQSDLTKGFDITLSETYFTITINKTLSEILSELYLNEPVTDVPEAIKSGNDYFLLVVTTANNEAQLRIAFQLTGNILRLSPDHIVF